MADPELNLCVIRCEDIEVAARFYRTIGLDLVKEKHRTGPTHYAAELGRLVFEIYPLGKRSPTTETRLGFDVVSVDDVLSELAEDTIQQPASRTERGYLAVVSDPDGHTVELIQHSDT
jgi:catechol 2,3-dioxygenase-like lactoylglutathione lyase family enzyme